MPSVVLFVNLKIVEGEINAFVKRAREHRERVLASEPDCQRFDISIPVDDENTVNLYEVYADEAALELFAGMTNWYYAGGKSPSAIALPRQMKKIMDD